MKKPLSIILSLAFLFCAAAAAQAEVFIRVDRDDPEAWRGELDNVRFLPEERMSGSAQFSREQFNALSAQLQSLGGEVWIVDCRMETHGLINGIAVSWCGGSNDANLGRSVGEIEAEEAGLSSLVGTEVTAYTAVNDRPADRLALKVDSWETECELVEGSGFHYLRLACPDHCWPPADVIDAFISFARELPADAWLHFHCQAGSGRTGAFMTIWEMMGKPDVSVEDILRHQAETGSGNLVDISAPEKSHAQKERCVLVRAMYLYLQENRADHFTLSWSEWLKAHSRTVTMKPGDRLDGVGFSSDPLVVTNALQAEAPGQATVLSGDTLLLITVD